MTPLDQAFVAANMNANKQNEFYTLFLNSTIYIPTHDVPANESTHRAGQQETINPIIAESNGVAYLMLFDTLDKLKSWTQNQVGYTGIPGHAIVEMMGTDLHWALNVGTEYSKIFTPDEISWLKQSIASQKAEQVTINPGTRIEIDVPAALPIGLIESLKQNLSARNPEIREAYLAQVNYHNEGEKPHLVLILRADPVDMTAIDGIRKDLAIAAKGFLTNDEYIDIAFDDGGIFATEIIKTIAPFYVR